LKAGKSRNLEASILEKYKNSGLYAKKRFGAVSNCAKISKKLVEIKNHKQTFKK